MRKFELGKFVTTTSVAELTVKCDEFDEFVADSLKRYADCDWGDMCEEDKAMNDEAVKNGARIFAAYDHSKFGQLWIISEADRSSTTVLLSSKY